MAKYLKGSTTIGELENLPNSYLHTIYKEYTIMLKDPKLQEANAGEEVMEQLSELS